MAVYVDSAKNDFGRMKMSHMVADTLEELHAMANKIGIQHKWFQDHSVPHYDICQSKRRLAIQLGVVEIDRSQLVNLIRHWRNRERKEMWAKLRMV